MTELLIVLTVALVFLGPERIPGVARMLGKFMREARSAMRDIQTSLHVEEVRQSLKKEITIDDITNLVDGGETEKSTENDPPSEISVKPAENVIAVGSVVADQGRQDKADEKAAASDMKMPSDNGQFSIDLFQAEEEERGSESEERKVE